MSLYNDEPIDAYCRGQYLDVGRLSQNARHDPLGFLDWLNQTAHWADAGNDFLITMLIRGLGFEAGVSPDRVARKYINEPVTTLDHLYSESDTTDHTRDLMVQMAGSYYNVFQSPLTAIMVPLDEYPWLERALPGSGDLSCTNGGQRLPIYRAMFFILGPDDPRQTKSISGNSIVQFAPHGLKPATLTIYRPRPGDVVNDVMTIQPYDFNHHIHHLVATPIDDDLRWPNVTKTLHGRILHA